MKGALFRASSCLLPVSIHTMRKANMKKKKFGTEQKGGYMFERTCDVYTRVMSARGLVRLGLALV